MLLNYYHLILIFKILVKWFYLHVDLYIIKIKNINKNFFKLYTLLFFYFQLFY